MPGGKQAFIMSASVISKYIRSDRFNDNFWYISRFVWDEAFQLLCGRE